MTNRKHLFILVVAAVLVGGMSGAITAPFAVRYLMKSPPTPEGVGSSGNGIHSAIGSEDSAIADVVQKVNPAVVNIAIYKDSNKLAADQGSLFEYFFGPDSPFQAPAPKQPDKKTKDNLHQVGGGSGFIVTSDGLIVTNKHVVVDEQAVYKVKLSDDKEYEAKVVARDPVLDVALIRIDAKNLSVLVLGDSDKLKLGQSVIAIGNALAEFGNTVTRGIVSGIGRKVEAGGGMGFTEVIDQAIQTDAAINPGNSGGPLLNLAGEVVGINTAVSKQGQLVGFAIPINVAKKTIESVQKTGHIVRSWLGVRYVPITPRLIEANNLKVKYGVLVSRGQSTEELAVVPGSPADKAGLVENDIILEVDGKKLEDKVSLSTEVGKHNVGDTVTLKVLHRGEEKTVKVKLEEFPNNTK